jgi:hypothetical protein
VDAKLKRIQDLKGQRKSLDEEIAKLTTEVTAELQAITRSNRKPRTKKEQQPPLPLNGGETHVQKS